MNKISIRFYNNREVRAIWSDDNSIGYYSATDIVCAINDESDYVKAGNYWRWLKKKLAVQEIQPVSDTHKFKSVGPDSKKRVADVMDDNGVLLLAKHYPNNRANEFLDWFTIRNNQTYTDFANTFAKSHLNCITTRRTNNERAEDKI